MVDFRVEARGIRDLEPQRAFGSHRKYQCGQQAAAAGSSSDSCDLHAAYCLPENMVVAPEFVRSTRRPRLSGHTARKHMVPVSAITEWVGGVFLLAWGYCVAGVVIKALQRQLQCWRNPKDAQADTPASREQINQTALVEQWCEMSGLLCSSLT